MIRAYVTDQSIEYFTCTMRDAKERTMNESLHEIAGSGLFLWNPQEDYQN